MKIGYVRVSTEEQNLARQEALMEDFHVERVFSEKLSGKDTNRPALNELLDFVRAGDTLVVESISRLGRSVRDLLQIIDRLQTKGVEFISHKEAINTSTPAGKFMLTVFAALAELERETLLVRQREGIDAARRAGKPLGRPKAEYPQNWTPVVSKWRLGEITAVDAMRRLGLTKPTFYRLLRRSGQA